MKTLFSFISCNLPFLLLIHRKKDPIQIFDTIKYIIPNLSNLSITSKDKTLSTTTRSTKVKNSNIRWNKFSHHRSNYHLKKRRKTLVVISRRERGSLGRLFGGREGARGLGPRQRFTCRPRYEALFVGRSTSIPRRVFEAEPRRPTRPFLPSFLPSVRLSLASASCKCFSACYRYLHKEGMMYAPRWVI